MIEKLVAEMPLRTLITMSRGQLKAGLVHRIIHAMNGHWWKAVFGGEVRSE